MKNKFKNLFLLFFSLYFCNCYGSWNPKCNGNDVGKRTRKLLQLTDEDTVFAEAGISRLNGKYDVLIFSDVHFGTRRTPSELPESFFNWLDSVKGTEKEPAFAICLGDIADVGKQSDYDEYLEFCTKLKNDYGIKMIFNVCGNHDIYQNHWCNWKNNCYPYTSFYKFKTSGFSWYIFDTASGFVGAQQYELLKSDLEEDANPKIMISHYPLTSFRPVGAGLNDSVERNTLIRDFSQSNVKCYFGGHNHQIQEHYLGFNDYLCPSLRYGQGWMILHIDETAGTASAEVVE